MSTAWTIAFDCADPAKLAAFWRQALGYMDGAPPAGVRDLGRVPRERRRATCGMG